MATLKQQIDAERRMRALLEQEGLPEPDEVEYGHTCIRLLWKESKACVVVDIDEVDEPGPEAPEAYDDAAGVEGWRNGESPSRT
jgi:hypothetical protein